MKKRIYISPLIEALQMETFASIMKTSIDPLSDPGSGSLAPKHRDGDVF